LQLFHTRRLLIAPLLIISLILTTSFSSPVHAAATLVQSANSVTNGGTTVSANFSTAATQNNLLIAVCGSGVGSVSITGPSGFSTAKNEAAITTIPGQGIFYKIANGGETSISCASSLNVRLGIQIYEYSGMATSGVLDAVNTTSSSSLGSNTPASGSVTTTSANTLLFAAVTMNANTSVSSWTNSFTPQGNFSNGGQAGSRLTYAAADRSVNLAGTYSTTASAGTNAAWRGQIAAFKIVTPVLSVGIVDSNGTPVANPTLTMAATATSFACQTTSGALDSGQKIRLTNTTNNPAWTLSIAASGGPTANWSTGSQTYKYNDSAGAGCTNGQLSINPASASLSPQSGCSTTGVTLGTNTAFASGVTDSITIASASSGSNINCYWDISGVTVSQTIPAETPVGNYGINMTLTVTAN
jgi:hypothetical protein